MDWRNIQNRINKIIQVDVMADDEQDFLSTHTPFQKLYMQNSGNPNDPPELIDENTAYDKLFRTSNDEHKMVIVRGAPGFGKSHFIRWLRARLHSDMHNPILSNAKIVSIRRVENNLRGTVRQLLEQNVVTDLSQREKMQKFLESSAIQNEDLFKTNIYFSFISYVENDSSDEYYKKQERIDIADFLKSRPVQEHLMQDGGPISGIYNMIAKPRTSVSQAETGFTMEDFKLSTAINRAINSTGSRSAQLFAARLRTNHEAEKLAKYLNHFIPSVVQSCAQITAGDTQEMIRQLRAELKNKGKWLIVLIEDITTFIGMDLELVKVLSTPHTGEFSDLCRVVSVIGVTDAYYTTHFLGNFQNRVTHQIYIDDTTFDSETLAQMAARYINSASLTQQELDNWFHNGAEPEHLPYRAYTPDYPWDSVFIDGRHFTLFPFTRKALTTLFNRLQEKTPRFFLRDVIKLQLSGLVAYKLDQTRSFPVTTGNALGSGSVEFVEAQHAARFDSFPMQDSHKEKLRALLCIWGNAHLRESEVDGHKTIADLPVEFLQDVGFEGISGIKGRIEGSSIKDESPKPAPTPTPPKPTGLTEYEKDLQDLESWYHNKTVLVNSEDSRRNVYEFIADAINWQMEGVPAYIAGARLSVSSIYIEDQRQQNSNRESAMVVVDRDSNGYFLLAALIHYKHHNRSWNFKDSAFFQLRAAQWLELHKDEIIARVKGEPYTTPMATFEWSMALEYLRLGITGNLECGEDDSSLYKKLFSLDMSENLRNDSNDKWTSLQNSYKNRRNDFKQNKDMLVSWPNTYMGTLSRGSTSRKYFFHRHIIDRVHAKLKSLNWDVDSLLPDSRFESEDILTKPANQLMHFIPRIQSALEDERNKLKLILDGLKADLGDKLDDVVWSKAGDDMLNFLQTYSSNYGGFYENCLANRAKDIKKSAEELGRIYKQACDILQGMPLSYELSFFSKDPCKKLGDVLATIKAVEKVAKDAERNAELEMRKIGVNNVDQNIVSLAINSIESLISKLEELGGEENA